MSTASRLALSERESSTWVKEFTAYLDAMRPVVLVSGGIAKVRCADCGKLTVAKKKREQKVGILCDRCTDGLVSEAVEQVREQLESGTPFEQTYTSYPIVFIRIISERYRNDLQAALLKLKTEYEPA